LWLSQCAYYTSLVISIRSGSNIIATNTFTHIQIGKCNESTNIHKYKQQIMKYVYRNKTFFWG